MDWPKRHTVWIEGRTLFCSVPFTWNLPEVKGLLMQRSFEWDRAIVGGPAVYLSPGYFGGMPWVSVGMDHPGVLQRINPMATRTTIGCIRSCGFCAVRRIEGHFRELADWPNLPVIVDNNLIASSQDHFDRVIDRLREWGWADFNQGLDCRLLNDHHARRISEIGRPMVRLALDSKRNEEQWGTAIEMLRSAGIPLKLIRSYALIGFDSGPDEAWERCRWIEQQGVKALPMWFHTLDAFQLNSVTPQQENLGWSDFERRRIMQWFYQHKRAVAK